MLLKPVSVVVKVGGRRKLCSSPAFSLAISVLRFIHDFTLTPKQLFRQDVTAEVAMKVLELRQHVLKGWLGQSEPQPWGF
jgi:hypothetical protein